MSIIGETDDKNHSNIMKPIISKYVLFFLLLVVFASMTQRKPVPGGEKVTVRLKCAPDPIAFISAGQC